jgi:hypothetical protein
MSWSWQRDLTLPVGQMLMESLWLYTTVVVVGTLTPVPLHLSLSTLIGLSLAAMLTAKGGAQVPLPPVLRVPLQLSFAFAALAGWLCWVLGAGLPSTPDASLALLMEPWRMRPAVTRPFLALAWGLGLYLTCRGLLIGTQARTAAMVGRWMIAGVGGLLFLFTCAALPGVSAKPLPADELRGLVVGYFVVGLATMALAHRQATYQGSGPRPKPSLAWLMAIALPILVVVGLGTLLVSGRATARTALALLAQLCVWLVTILWSVLAYLLGALVWLLRQLAAWLAAGDAAGPSPVGRGPLSLSPEPPRFQLPTLVLPGAELHVEFAIGALAVLAVVLYLYALNRARTSLSGATLEDGSFAWSWALSLRQLRRAWAGLLDRLHSRTARAAVRIMGLRPRRREALGDIRSIYRALLRWAAEHGRERPRDATPHEFAAQLVRTAANAEKQIELITESYVQTRYGTALPDEAALREARQCIQDLPSRLGER